MSRYMSPVRKYAVAAAAVASFAVARDAHATFEEAGKAFNDDNFVDAAVLFADLLDSDNADERVQAEYYLAHSLYKSGYLVPAYQYYGEVFNQGPAHPFFLKATAGLVSVATDLRDDLVVPQLLDQGYVDDFRNLSPDALNTVNYLVGTFAYRRGNLADARDFLSAVSPDAGEYLKARYFLGVVSLNIAMNEEKVSFDKTLGYFKEVADALEGTLDPEEKRLYRLAILGMARTYYTQGEYSKSVEFYEKVPRFSEDWYDAMFESGWAYRQNAFGQTSRRSLTREIGKALGMVHSVQSPYFDGRLRAESFVLRATAYFDMCHFDRTRKTTEEFFDLYEPMAEALKPYIVGDQTDEEMIALIEEGSPSFPNEVRFRIASNSRYQKFLAQVEEIREEIARAEEFPNGSFKSQMMAVLQDQLDGRTSLLSRIVRGQIETQAGRLEELINKGRIILLETAKSERIMLEAGKDTSKGPRARGPRPLVPSASSQFWSFNDEYWIDELGYYQYSIKNECVDELYQ